MRYLIDREGQPVARDTLLRDVWGYEWTGGSNVVDVAISGLRRKLGDRAGALQTVRGVGYRFKFRMITGVPSGTRRISRRSGRSPTRTQPVETGLPRLAGMFVPWRAIRFPPGQFVGSFAWTAEIARMQQP